MLGLQAALLSFCHLQRTWKKTLPFWASLDLSFCFSSFSLFLEALWATSWFEFFCARQMSSGFCFFVPAVVLMFNFCINHPYYYYYPSFHSMFKKETRAAFLNTNLFPSTPTLSYSSNLLWNTVLSTFYVQIVGSLLIPKWHRSFQTIFGLLFLVHLARKT